MTTDEGLAMVRARGSMARCLRRALLPGTVAVGTGGCAHAPSTLSPAGTGAADVRDLWWVIFGIAAFVCVVVIGWMLLAVARRRGPDVEVKPGEGSAVVLTAGFVLPMVILIGVFFAGLGVMRSLAADKPAAVTIDVRGHDWWWEVRYPTQQIVTANEFHIPVGQRVRLELTSSDVIHSFWLPQLMPKTDLIPGQTNQTWLLATRPGRFRGQCAEFCGPDHGYMAFYVVADEPAQYDAWLQQMQQAPGPVTGQAALGRTVFETASCASCHTIQGTSAQGQVGPDLTHLQDRRTIGAGTVPNTAGYLGGWIENSQQIKPGNLMPPQALSPTDLRAVIAYLETLR